MPAPVAPPLYDVAIVGYGPVSQALALMLGRQGRSVIVIERWERRYPLPRAVCVDHELYRVLAANGMGKVLPAISHPGPEYRWFNEDWRELLMIDWSAKSISGGAEVNFVHQPTLEEAMDREVAALDNVTVALGCEVRDVVDDGDLVRITCQSRDHAEPMLFNARYVVGCDGANSLVRKTIGSGFEDQGFEADWLVIDVALKDGKTLASLGIPEAAQYCNPRRPTTIVPAGIREGRLYRRWEFMRLPGESASDLESEARTWELLRPWVGPEDVELVRHKIYTFRSLVADKWRSGRLMIGGDAAHVMPPFMGQGMCSGFRDAWNLAWRLGLLFDGKADDRLLDQYQLERKPHVDRIVAMSIYLGRIICIPDQAGARERDEMFLGGHAPPPPPFPSLTGGLIDTDAQGDPIGGAGLVAPHAMVRFEGRTASFDEIFPPAFMLILAPDVEVLERRATSIPLRTIRLGHGAGSVEDVDGNIREFLAARQWSAMIVRPDFYIYGTASSQNEVAPLLSRFGADLENSGVHAPNHQNKKETAA